MLTGLQRSIGTDSYAIALTRDADGRVTVLDYPSGNRLHYSYDVNGRVSGLSWESGGTTDPVVSNVAYLPFGPVSGLTYGDGSTQTRSYDSGYRLTALEDISGGVTLRDITLSYDARDDLTAIADLLSPTNNETYGYTIRQKLDAAAGAYGQIGYGYDGVGNRISLSRSTPTGNETDSYLYAATSNRLEDVLTDGVTTRSMSYDAAGNQVSDSRPDGLYGFAYDAAGRLASVTKNGLLDGEYLYNTEGQMVSRTIPGLGAAVHVVHGPWGNRLAEYDATTGAVLIEFIWLDSEPVAAVTGGQMYYLRTDHIGRPVLATTALGVVASTTRYKPFGEVHAATGLDTGLRFPGQVYISKAPCIRTGCGITIRQPAATSRPTRWGWSMARASMAMRCSRRGGLLIRGACRLMVQICRFRN